MSTSFSPDYWDEAKQFLCKKDKTLKKIIQSYDGELMVTRGDAFYTLARSITGQQISVKAADSVWRRVEAAAISITPKNIADCPGDTLRSCGLSQRKVVYLQGLAHHFIENGPHIKRWPKLSDDELVKELVALKGIGRWTAEMLMIFHFARPDIFPVDDLGVLKAIYRHYNNSQKMPLADVRRLSERWQPWRTVATWYLWRALDPVPVEY